MTILTDNGSTIDLKQLLILLDDDLQLNADLCLDLDCRIVTRDPKAFTSLLRGVITHVREHTHGTLSIGLSALRDAFDLAVVGRTDAATISLQPEVSLETFRGTLSFDFSPKKYLKAVIRFDRS